MGFIISHRRKKRAKRNYERDLPIFPPSDFPGVLIWENAVNENDPTTPIYYRGGNIITVFNRSSVGTTSRNGLSFQGFFRL